MLPYWPFGIAYNVISRTIYTRPISRFEKTKVAEILSSLPDLKEAFNTEIVSYDNQPPKGARQTYDTCLAEIFESIKFVGNLYVSCAVTTLKCLCQFLGSKLPSRGWPNRNKEKKCFCHHITHSHYSRTLPRGNIIIV